MAEKLAAEGATVVVTDINETTAEETAAAIGGDAIALVAGVTSPESVEAMVAQVNERFGRIDVLVNNAGWDKAGPFIESDPADWDAVIAINLYGVLNTSKAVLPLMAEQGYGTVVNIASDAATTRSCVAHCSAIPLRWLAHRPTSRMPSPSLLRTKRSTSPDRR